MVLTEFYFAACVLWIARSCQHLLSLDGINQEAEVLVQTEGLSQALGNS